MSKHILISILTLTCAFSSAAKDKEQIIATVDGVKITKALFDETYKQNLLFVSDKLVTKEKVIYDLINRELGIKKAKKAKLSSNPVVKRKMEDIMYHAQISKDLEPKLKKILVTDSDVKSYYKSNPEYKTAHILFRMRANPSKEEEKAALNQSLKIFNALKAKPEAFPEFANKFSQSSTAPNGGNMGFQPAVRLAPEYWKAIKGKANNFITSPVRTQFGYHIVKVLDVKNFKNISTPLYKKIVYDQKRDKILDTYFKELRKSSKISINKALLK